MTAQTAQLIVRGQSVPNPVILCPHDASDPSKQLTLESFVAVTRGDDQGQLATVALSEESVERIRRSQALVEKAVRESEQRADATGDVSHLDHIYGINTGFGCNRNVSLGSYEEACRLSEFILYSHATGIGRPLPSEIVRGMMLLRLRTFAEGRSGVRLELVRFVIEMLNNKVHPYVPEKGSVGASGDLCPSAHLFLPLVGAGAFWCEPDYPNRGGPHTWNDDIDLRGAPLSGDDELERVAGLQPLPSPIEGRHPTKEGPRLAPKEGLGVTNGTALSTAILALGTFDAQVLWTKSNLVGSMSLQAVGGPTRAFDPKVQAVRPHPGQIASAAAIMHNLRNRSGELSILVNRAPTRGHSQDDYSIRAMAAVHGATYDAIKHVGRIVEIELNAATDNPLFFAESDDSSAADETGEQDRLVSRWPAYAAANFHGEPIALAADYLKIAVSEVASISERRIQLMLDSGHNRGLPTNLTGGEVGLNSGFMVTQYSAAAIVSENKVLSHPSSVDSIPTSSNAEDHVSMSAAASRHLRTVVVNAFSVLAIESLCARQAILLRLLNRTVESPSDPDNWHDVFDVHKLSWDERLTGIGTSSHDLIRRLGESLAAIAQGTDIRIEPPPPYQIITSDLDFRYCPPLRMIRSAVEILRVSQEPSAFTAR